MFLEAVAHVPIDQPDMWLPVSRLLRAAVECRLKGYLLSVRGGAPDTSDLTRLTTLAGLCGLTLTVEQRGSIALLDAEADGSTPARAKAALDGVVSAARAIRDQTSAG